MQDLTPTVTLLERSDQLAALADRLEAVRTARRGRLVLVAGEAGIGKTALVRVFCDDAATATVLAGACDALHTPRPLGPFVDIAEEAGGELAAQVAGGTTPAELLAALTREARRRAPAVLVLEDLHWADEATLDVLRLLARRIEALPALVLGTYRDDEVDTTHPLRVVLGELPRGNVERIMLPPLSLAAVTALAAGAPVDPAALHSRTDGNPFFVTEALAASGELPDTVRDAVLARAARLDDGARALLGAVAIVPLRAELWLLEALAGDPGLAALDACLASGMLRAERDAVAFRHEIARVVIEAALAPHRRLELHRRALAALAADGSGRADLARLAHHADAAGDREAVLRHAPAAGERAAQLGSHREAAAQFARALRHADGLAPERRAELLERRAYECYLTDSIVEAIEARRWALAEHRAAGDALREGDTHRWLSRLAWFRGESDTAWDEARAAVAQLEPLPPGRELAMAYSNMAHLAMLHSDERATRDWGGRAIALAEALGETEILIHALNNVGSVGLVYGAPDARAALERSLALALEAGLEEHVARAYTNLGSVAVAIQDYELGVSNLEAGIAYCRDRDLDSWLLYMSGHMARVQLDLGRWDEAASTATFVLHHPDVSIPSRITPLVALGLLRARRGDPGRWAPLDEALEHARATAELQRLGPVAAARAEAVWLAGEDERIGPETEAALALAVAHGERWITGELLAWRRRAGIADEPAAAAEPYALELAGEHEAAAERWRALGCRYEAALASAHASSPELKRRAVAELQALGARPAAKRIARELRELGVRDVRHGPRAATRGNPAGLTGRELEVLALVAEGLRNADIAARLFVSDRTVEHHVSAIMRKLEVQSRGQAGAAAARLGIVER